MENGALDAMLDAIRETASGEGQAEFSRNRIIVLLDVIAEHLDPMLEQPVTQDDNCEVVRPSSHQSSGGRSDHLQAHSGLQRTSLHLVRPKGISFAPNTRD